MHHPIIHCTRHMISVYIILCYTPYTIHHTPYTALVRSVLAVHTLIDNKMAILEKKKKDAASKEKVWCIMYGV